MTPPRPRCVRPAPAEVLDAIRAAGPDHPLVRELRARDREVFGFRVALRVDHTATHEQALAVALDCAEAYAAQLLRAGGYAP